MLPVAKGKKRRKQHEAKPIDPVVRARLGFPDDMPDEEVWRLWKSRAYRVCKPCWELKYCPYGPLVEDSPLLPPTRDQKREHIAHLKNCLATGKIGEQLSDEEREHHRRLLAGFDENDYDPDPTGGELTAIQRVGHGRDRKLTREAAVYFYEEAKRRLEGDGLRDISDPQRKQFEEQIQKFVETDYPEEIPEEIREMECNVFGHICPVIFNAEMFTETSEMRRSGRYIPFKTKMRVVRRDNYTCQHCGKHLLDNEVEFDHVIPHAKGGSVEEHNIRLTCFKCNRDKSDDVTL